MFQEDAGGPLIHRFRQPGRDTFDERVIGIAVYSNGNATSPNVYARMSVYHEYIRLLAIKLMDYADRHPEIQPASTYEKIKKAVNRANFFKKLF